jgi:3,4-dihydroxy 2-butanone 4-phosphate synthase / GTP cyclohydrolase II
MAVTWSAAQRVVSTTLPTRYGNFRIHGYVGHSGEEHVALVLGNINQDQPGTPPPLVRVHSECLTGDVLGSWRCDCGDQLEGALTEISTEARGIVIYLRGHEGRGIGLHEKLRAYELQNAGQDTIDANLRLGHPADARNYAAAAAILADLGASRIRLLSANPDKALQLRRLGIDIVSRHMLIVPDRPDNVRYLQTKRSRMGHDDVRALPSVWHDLTQRRVPTRAAVGADTSLLERYGSLAGASDIVIAQLAQSADGFIAARNGDAHNLSGSADLEHLHRLRALVDAVVVGVSTVVADNPQLTVRNVSGPSPVRVIIDPHGRAPLASRLLTEEAARTLWCVGEEAATPESPPPHVEIVRLAQTAAGWLDPAVILQVLRRAGHRRVLIEGGGRTVSGFLRAGLLDRLYLTTVPKLIGNGVPGIRFAGRDDIREALAAPVSRFVLGEDLCTVFDFAAVG